MYVVLLFQVLEERHRQDGVVAILRKRLILIDCVEYVQSVKKQSKGEGSRPQRAEPALHNWFSKTRPN